MKRVIFALILGAAAGYRFGYGDGTEGRPSIMARTLDRFGTSKVKAAQDARERRVQEASRP
jgi:hypothetical protein